ncbi:hypothetical protein ABK040_001300 [Willaertia magna]
MNLARRLVSKKKKRYQEDGFDLDLTYVTPKIIAMGFPSLGKESIYRNRMEDVQRLLKKNHGDNFKVYNLCSERTYEPSFFDGRVERFPFDDHNAPPFEIMIPCCRSIDEWIKADSKNVAIIHCKAGKGRTGTMICAYLIYAGIKENAPASLDFYAESRTHNKEGVTIPSQVRYVQYFDIYKMNGYNYPRGNNFVVYLDKIQFYNLPKDLPGTIVNVVIKDKNDNDLLNIKSKLDKDNEVNNNCFVIKNKERMALKEDLSFNFKGNGKSLFHFWINTFFIPKDEELNSKKYIYKLTKRELDKACKKEKYEENFYIELHFSEALITNVQKNNEEEEVIEEDDFGGKLLDSENIDPTELLESEESEVEARVLTNDVLFKNQYVEKQVMEELEKEIEKEYLELKSASMTMNY